MRLEEIHKEYVKTVSTPIWACSLELCQFLDRYLKIFKPRNVLDLGSGISSYVFRSHVSEVTTVDTSEEWLNKTKAFLEKHNTQTKNMILLKDFQWNKHYDFCLLDIAGADINRAPLLPKLIPITDDIILDDMHLKKYRAQVFKIVPQENVKDLINETLDNHHRFASMLINPRFTNKQ